MLTRPPSEEIEEVIDQFLCMLVGFMAGAAVCSLLSL